LGGNSKGHYVVFVPKAAIMKMVQLKNVLFKPVLAVMVLAGLFSGAQIMVLEQQVEAATCNNGGVSGRTATGRVGVAGCNQSVGGTSSSVTPPSGPQKAPPGKTWCIQIKGPAYWGSTYYRDGRDCELRPAQETSTVSTTCVIAQHILRDGSLVDSRGAALGWHAAEGDALLPYCLDVWEVDLCQYVPYGTAAVMSTALSYKNSFPALQQSTKLVVTNPGPDCPGGTPQTSTQTDVPSVTVAGLKVAQTGGGYAPTQAIQVSGRALTCDGGLLAPCGKAPNVTVAGDGGVYGPFPLSLKIGSFVLTPPTGQREGSLLSGGSYKTLTAPSLAQNLWAGSTQGVYEFYVASPVGSEYQLNVSASGEVEYIDWYNTTEPIWGLAYDGDGNVWLDEHGMPTYTVVATRLVHHTSKRRETLPAEVTYPNGRSFQAISGAITY